MDVELRTEPGLRVAYVVYEGPLVEIGKAFERLQAWLIGHKAPTTPMIGVYADGVGEPDVPTRAEIWAPFAKEVGPESVPRLGIGKWPVEVKEVEADQVAACVFEGDAHRLPAFEAALRRFLETEGLAPARSSRHVYFGTAPEAEAWRIEVQIPVSGAAAAKP